jgi:hypothetical protein
MSGQISSIHSAAKLDYANRHSGNKRRYVSAMGSNDQCGGRIGQRSCRGQDGRGRGRGNERKTFANNIDITDLHRNFTPDKRERRGFMRSYVLQLQDGGRGGCGSRSNQTYQGSNANQTASSRSAANRNSNNSVNATNLPADQLVVSKISEQGS